MTIPIPRLIPRLIPIAALVFGVACQTDTTASEPTTTDAPESPSETTEAASDAPTTSEAPATEAAPAEDPEVTAARGTAQDYLDYSGFCRPALISQVMYEGYSDAAAATAVDSLGVDWAAETVRVAQSYVDYSDFSHQGLVDQLEYEGCEPDHAEQAATQVLGF